MQAAIEEIIASVVKDHSIAILNVRPVFYFVEEEDLEAMLFTQTDNTVTLHSAFMPTEERLLQWVDRLRVMDPHLERFRLEMSFNGLNNDSDDEYAKFGEFTNLRCVESHQHVTVIRTMPDATTSENADCVNFSSYRYVYCPGHVKRCYDMLVGTAQPQGIPLPPNA
jgi:hypothetical protein